MTPFTDVDTLQFWMLIEDACEPGRATGYHGMRIAMHITYHDGR